MGRVILHAVPPMQRRQFLLVLARAKELQVRGEDVLLTYCAASAGTCSSNLLGNPVACAVCRRSTRATAERMRLTAVPLTPPEGPVARLDYSCRKSLATGVTSSLVTHFRVLPNDLPRFQLTQAIKRRYFATASRLYQAIQAVFDQSPVTRVEVVNGRHACDKFCLVAARARQIPFNTLEYTAANRPIVFAGHTPHDRVMIQRRILSQPCDMKLAAEYFERRKSAAHNRFAAHHRRYALPDAGRTPHKRVSFFLSSRDECESLGADWRSVFRDDARVIRLACQTYPDHFFCVRFHPNQAGIAGDVARGYRCLESLSNLQIYYPDADVDSYGLIDWSDLVVTFASTVAVEACWGGKPVIQLGPSFYDRLDVSYNPSTVDAFLELLGSDLRPRDRANAARLAAYLERDGDPLLFLETSRSRTRPVGFRRRMPVLAKAAKELNSLSRRVLKTYFHFAYRAGEPCLETSRGPSHA